MNFVLQSRDVLSKLSKLNGIFYALVNYMPQKTLITLFYSFVYPTIINNLIIWGGISQSHTVNIKVAINKILRCILRVGYNENYLPIVRTNRMYKDLKILQFNDIYKYSLLKFVHFVLYERCDLFMHFFSEFLPDHSYNTRNVKINLPYARLNIEQQSTVFQCCSLINNLDDSFLVPQSKFRLKNLLRNIA